MWRKFAQCSCSSSRGRGTTIIEEHSLQQPCGETSREILIGSQAFAMCKNVDGDMIFRIERNNESRSRKQKEINGELSWIPRALR
jgi:hypothetical protein